MSIFSSAVNRIRGLSSTYFHHPAMLQAKAVASRLATNPYVVGGAVTGAAGGVGYDMATNDRSNWRSKIESGVYGGLLGGALGGLYAGARSLPPDPPFAQAMAGIRSGMSTARSRAMNYGARGIRGMARGLDNLGNSIGGI